jgi:hypothetical protein
LVLVIPVLLTTSFMISSLIKPSSWPHPAVHPPIPWEPTKPRKFNLMI